ncbi:DUF1129 family protein [Virgibacillus doumboii]|uniref:DUF1129 family protein n=1 Tax=Virgibacillus doumboii TaxID=2697503 RepID=UPI0013E0B50E|nr:DUF1129 family protein [Virgibacillus doumboii]
MNAKDIIQLNNEKREQLTEENLSYYGNMLVYIRMKSNKSEQHTEEVLLELLEHLLQAQEEGRTAEDVFGTDPESYCKEVIEEIPGEKTSHHIKFWGYIIIQFLAIISLVHGILGGGLHYFFGLGADTLSFALGSGIVTVLIDFLLLLGFLALIFKWLKATTFRKKQPKKWVEFLQLWVVCTCAIGLFVLVPYIMPSFGAEISIPTFAFAGLGVVLYLISFYMNKKYRLTK